MPKAELYLAKIVTTVTFTKGATDYSDGKKLAQFSVSHSATTDMLVLMPAVVDNLHELVVDQVKKEIEVKIGEESLHKPFAPTVEDESPAEL